MAGVALGMSAAARVVTYPAPAGAALSAAYRVRVAGQRVDVYEARVLDPPFAGKQWDYGGPYAFGNFDTDGPVEVRIMSRRSLANVVVRPRSAGVEVVKDDDYTVILKLDGPRKLSIEPDGRRGPLLLFANPLETEVPRPDDPGVVFFGPGVHRPEKIELGTDQTLYFTMTAFLFEPGEDMHLEDVSIEHVRIHGEGQESLIRLRPVVNQYMRKKVPGFVERIRFQDISVDGEAGNCLIQLIGADAKHDVRDVTLESIRLGEAPLTQDSPQLQIGPHATDITVRTAAQ